MIAWGRNRFRIRQMLMCTTIVFFLFQSAISNAQSISRIRFILTFNGAVINKMPYAGVLEKSDTVLISEFQFYVHHIRLLSNGKEIYSNGNNHLLVNANDLSSMSIEFPCMELEIADEVSFVIGVDSIMQSNGAHSGTLDPIHGMYWTWQSGYIHWKLEAETIIGGNSETIAWHVGGYRQPFNTLRRVSLPLVSDNKQLKIGIDLFGLLSVDQEVVDRTIMSPSKQAMQLADRFQNSFQWLAH